MATNKILILGACGQIGVELTTRLREIHGTANVIASDIRPLEAGQPPASLPEGPYEVLDVTSASAVGEIFQRHQPTIVYNLASLLSAKSEQLPDLAWQVNIAGHLNVLKACVTAGCQRLFWPSSIAVFGPDTPAQDTPQSTILNPNTIYGISKLTGERWCEYYYQKHGLDIRSIRYPGLISYKSPPGGGTTDYAVAIFYEALRHRRYTSYLSAATRMPMMFMEDAIRGTLELMDAPAAGLSIRSSYNFAAVSFTVEELASAIRVELPDFAIDYAPDFRQAIADSWPESIDDQFARREWGWRHSFDLEGICREMLSNITADALS